MLTILKERFMSFNGERSIVIAELAVDSKDELPAQDGVEGRVISHGTLAWEIGTGDLYGFSGDGKWVNQTTGETIEPEE